MVVLGNGGSLCFLVEGIVWKLELFQVENLHSNHNG
jgi:hypothetical protein